MATSSQPKHYLLTGFDAAFNNRHVEFVDCLPATVPLCSFCSALASQHYTLSCEHVFCSACFEDVVKTHPSSLRCPIDDRSMRNRKAVPMQITDFDAVNRLLVFCWNRQRGCPYTGHLADMPRHFQGCAFYEVVCSLCSDTMPRLNLPAHFRAAHEKRRRSTRQYPATGDDPIPATDTRSTQPPPARESSEVSTASTSDEESGDAVPDRSVDWCDGIALNVYPRLNKDVAEVVQATVSKVVEDVKQQSDELFLEIFIGIELLKTRLVALADSVRLETSGLEGATIDLRPRQDNIVTSYTWVVGPYSSFRLGVNYVDSPVFFIVPGYKVQLRARIYGMARVELSVSVKVYKRCASDVARSSELPWPFERTCLLTLLHNSDDDRNLVNLFPPCDAFNEPQAPAKPPDDEVLSSRWLKICKIEPAIFERDNVKDDTFTIDFRTRSPQA